MIVLEKQILQKGMNFHCIILTLFVSIFLNVKYFHENKFGFLLLDKMYFFV